jgi:hypothetical protein
MKTRVNLFAVLLVLLLLLSACGTPPQATNPDNDLWTEARFGAYTQQMGRNAALTVQGQNNEALSALAAIPEGGPVGSLAALANPDNLNDPNAVNSLLQGLSVAGLSNYSQLAAANNSGAVKLPRGKYTFDGSTWNMTGNSDDLVLNFPFGNLDGTTSSVTLDINWDKYKKTTVVTDGALSYEVPTGLQLRSYVDLGKGDKSNYKSGYIDIYADWYKSTCGTTLLEPSKLALKGEFGYKGAINIQFEVNIKKSQKGEGLQAAYFGNNTAVESDGYVKVSAGSDSGKVFWDNIFYATITRGGNCTLSGFVLDRGEIDFGASFTIGGKTDTAQLRFEFSNLKIGADLATSSLDLDGKIKANGQIVVLFEGTLEATGQKLKLTFADGSVTLAQFVEKFLADLELDLGNLPLPSLPSIPTP